MKQHTANLVWITPFAETLIAKIARVSNPSNEDNPHITKLLHYLIKHKHWSPFEMASMCVEIHTTRAIAPQILRHRSFSFQEFSLRYSPTNPSIPIEPPQLRGQDTENRQNSIVGGVDDVTTEIFDRYIKRHFEQSLAIYRQLLKNGVAKECARSVLPLETPTRLYMSGTIRSWLHYYDLRSDSGTQLEHQQIALDVKEMIKKELPNVFNAMELWNKKERNDF